jgi:hypothetical protein
MITHAPNRIAYELILQLGLNSGGWGLGFGSLMPPQGTGVPSNYIYVFRSSDINDGAIIDKQNANRTKLLMAYGFQIRVRGSVYETTEQKLKQIIDALIQIRYQTLVVAPKTYLIEIMQLIGGILPMGQQEQNKLEHFSSNWLLKAQEV